MQNTTLLNPEDSKNSASLFNAHPVVFRAKPSTLVSAIPSELTQHTFQRFTVDSRALSVETTLLTTMREHLVYAVDQIADDVVQLTLVRNIMADARFIQHVQKNVWPKAENEIKINVRSVTEEMLNAIVSKAINETASNNINSSGRLLITAIIGVALEYHGILDISIPSFATRMHINLFPTWDNIVLDGIRALAQSHFSSLKPENGLQKKAIGRIALMPLANLFDDINTIIDKIKVDRNQFYGLAAASIAKVLHMDEALGDYRGVTEESEVSDFASNATYMLAYMDHLRATKQVPTDSFIVSELRKVPMLSFGRRITAAASILREIPHYRVGSLDTLIKNTTIHHVLDHVGALSGVMISPNFRVSNTVFMVSEFLHGTMRRNLIEKSDVEDVFNNMFSSLSDVFQKLPEQTMFVMENISEKYNAGVALDVAANDTLIDGTPVSDAIYPLCIGLNLTGAYLRLLAVAYSTFVNIRLAETEENFLPMTYIFDTKQKDVNRVLYNLAEDTCFTTDEATVVAFGSTTIIDSGFWEVGTQNITPEARKLRYIGVDTSDNAPEISILGNMRNYIDREWKISIQIPGVEDSSVSVTTEANLYELITATKYMSGLDRDHVFVHFAPALSARMETMVDFYLSLTDTASSDGEIVTANDRIRVMLADCFSPVIKTGAFRSLLVSIRGQLLAQASIEITNRSVLNYIRKRLVTGEFDVDIASSLLFNVLRKAHLIRQDQHQDLVDVSMTKEFRQSMLSIVRA